MRQYLKLKLILLIAFTVILSGCGKSTTTPEEQSVDVRIDILGGFAGMVVDLNVDGEDILVAEFGLMVPLAGPLLTKSISLDRGTSILKIAWASETDTGAESLDINLGGAAKYYLLVDLINGLVHLEVRTEAPLYL